MFARVVSLLALLPMLSHGVMGCCWHHAPASPLSVCGGWIVGDASSDSTCDVGCRCCGGPTGRPCDGGRGTPPSPCHKKACQLTSAVLPPAVGLADSFGVGQGGLWERPSDDTFVVALIGRPSGAGPDHGPPDPARRRAWIQVWRV